MSWSWSDIDPTKLKPSDFDPTNKDARFGKEVAAAGDAATTAMGAPSGSFTAATEGIKELNHLTGNTFTLNNIRNQVSHSQDDNQHTPVTESPPVHQNHSPQFSEAEYPEHVSHNPEMHSPEVIHNSGNFGEHSFHPSETMTYNPMTGSTIHHYDNGSVLNESYNGSSTYYDASSGSMSHYDASTGNTTTYEADGDTIYHSTNGSTTYHDASTGHIQYHNDVTGETVSYDSHGDIIGHG